MARIRIINKTKEITISESAKLCHSLLQKATGLMFSRQKDLIFEEKVERIVRLHMFFVFYPIDVIFLNKDKQVVELKQHFKPFTFYNPLHKAQYIIELKAGTIEQTHTTLNHALEFRSIPL
jgi:uncharacterized protein